jgi:hypothetical protein
MGQRPLVLQYATLARMSGYTQESRKLASPDTVYFPSRNRYSCRDKVGVPLNSYLLATDPTPVQLQTRRISDNSTYL